MITLGYASAGGELMMRTNIEAYTRIKVLISREHPEKIQAPLSSIPKRKSWTQSTMRLQQDMRTEEGAEKFRAIIWSRINVVIGTTTISTHREYH